MEKIFTLKLNHMLKKTLVCATMLGIVFFALASSGGGKKKASSSALGVIPITPRTALSLKTKPAYTGSHLLSTTNSCNTTVFRSVVTYQKGNTTYLIPSKYRMSNSPVTFKSSGLSLRSNLNVIDLKIRLCR